MKIDKPEPSVPATVSSTGTLKLKSLLGCLKQFVSELGVRDFDEGQPSLSFIQRGKVGNSVLGDYVLGIVSGHGHPGSLRQVRHDTRYRTALSGAGQDVYCPASLRPESTDYKVELSARAGEHGAAEGFRGDSSHQVDFNRAVYGHHVFFLDQ